MFFRNLSAYTLPGEFARDLRGKLDDALAGYPPRELGPLDSCSRGFVQPFGIEPISCDQSGGTLFQLGGEDKVIPASAVKKAVHDKISEISEKEGRRVGAKERRYIKEEILTRMLAQAFVQDYRLAAYIDWQERLLIVDAATESAATGLIENLRLATGSLPAIPLLAEESPRVLMTNWVQTGQLPDGFALSDEAELIDPSEGGAKVRFSRQDLETDEVREHIAAGKLVVQLGLTFDGAIQFVLGDDMVIRKVKLLDHVTDELVDADMQTAQDEIATRFTLTVREFRRLYRKLEEIFGFNRPDEGAQGDSDDVHE